MTHSRARAGFIQDKPGETCSARKQESAQKQTKKPATTAYGKGNEKPNESARSGQSQNK